jgi:multimeric flavodoxin WrbA
MESNAGTLTAVALVCSLKPSPQPSSSEKLAREVLDALSEHGVSSRLHRVVDYDVRPGVEKDMGDGDQWPLLREAVMECDILIISTPIWMGQMSSVAKRVLERLDAELSETNDKGQPFTYGKVAGACVVGNEDGAHATSADLFQALNDVGFSIPPGAVTYWTGEAMSGVDYNDLDDTPDKTASTTKTLAANAAHLARSLAGSEYPAIEE